MRLRVVAPLCWIAGAAGWACGGAASPADGPAPPTGGSRGASPEGESAPEAVPAVAPPPRCTDGTCLPCGDGYCLSGAYCDEEARGGPACAWLPACGATSSCACLEKAMPGCRCEEADGSARLRCAPP